MSEGPETWGVILAGGLARRMGGGDKGLLPVGGRPILARVAERLAPQCAGLILNANGEPGRLAGLGLVQVPDGMPGFPGPLAGILAALDWTAAERPSVEWVASAAGDLPFLPGDFVRRLHAAREAAGASLVSASSGGRIHPVNGVWAVALRADLRGALEAGERRVGRWTASQGAAIAEWPVEPRDPFFNVNAPADLEEAERLDRSGRSRDRP